MNNAATLRDLLRLTWPYGINEPVKHAISSVRPVHLYSPKKVVSNDDIIGLTGKERQVTPVPGRYRNVP